MDVQDPQFRQATPTSARPFLFDRAPRAYLEADGRRGNTLPSGGGTSCSCAGSLRL